MLNLPRLTVPRYIAINPNTGRPVSLGSVAFYTAGTTSPKDVFLDRFGAVLAPNPFPLDAAGTCAVYLNGIYRIEVFDASGAKLYDEDQVNSTPVELESGNPGSLLISNNLADLANPAVARDVLGLPRQESASDAAAGRVMLVGAFGLGGSAPRAQASNQLSDLGSLVSGALSVALSDVATVGGPSTAPAGVCVTLRMGGQDSIAQAYYPTEGLNATPWRRTYTYSTAAWTAWRRDLGAFEGATGWSSRSADGSQTCYLQQLDATFSSADSLLATWTFPIAFSGRPHFVGAVLRPADDGANSTTIPAGLANVTLSDISGVHPGGIASGSCHFRVMRRTGGPAFVSGDKVSLMCRAEGRWYS